MKNFIAASLASYIGLATALLLPKDISQSTNFLSLQSRSASCANTATSRGCWGEYSIDTNYYEEIPDTGVTREYWLKAQNTTLAPDVNSRNHLLDFWSIKVDHQQGVERLTLNFNGQIPGPLITADWGDNCELGANMLRYSDKQSGRLIALA